MKEANSCRCKLFRGQRSRLDEERESRLQLQACTAAQHIASDRSLGEKQKKQKKVAERRAEAYLTKVSTTKAAKSVANDTE